MQLNKYIDHTLLKADASMPAIRKLCNEAKKYKFASVCVNPYYVPFCRVWLKGSKVKVCTVIGFPLGQMSLASKAVEASNAIKAGAQEVDMVLNIAALKDKELQYVTDEIKTIAKVCHAKKVILKVIIETCLLTKQEKINACKCVSKAKADFIKTSTGFSTGGATVADVKLLRKYTAKTIKVKAAGGIRNKQDALDMIKAGADRLGTSKGVLLVTGK